jgi:hypothetical protein
MSESGKTFAVLLSANLDGLLLQHNDLRQDGEKPTFPFLLGLSDPHSTDYPSPQ